MSVIKKNDVIWSKLKIYLGCDIVFFSNGKDLYGWPINEGRSVMIENLIRDVGLHPYNHLKSGIGSVRPNYTFALKVRPDNSDN